MSKSFFRTTAALITGWVVLLGLLSLRGFFSNFSALPPRLALAGLTPLPVILLFIRSKTGKAVLQWVQPQWLIFLQSFRILVELGLWLLVRHGSLPVQMSFEGRNFDVLTGLLAIPVGYYCFVKKSWPRGIAVVYNIAGLLLLLNAVVIAMLSMPTPLRMFPSPPDSSLITRFPYIYLPGVLVPLAYTLHILSLRQGRTYRSSDPDPAIISAQKWFNWGRRLSYDPTAKEITGEDTVAQPERLYVFNSYFRYPDQKPGQFISFLPGFPTGSYDWVKIDALIEKQQPLNRLFVEYVGQGESDKPEDYPYSTFERADLVEALWKHHRIGSTFIVTFDYSSLVAMELLRRQLKRKERGIPLSTVITDVLFINGGYFTDGHSHPILTTPLLKTQFGKRGTMKAQSSDPVFNRMIKGMWSKDYQVGESELAEFRDAIRRRNGAVFLHYAAGFVDEHKANRERLDLLDIVGKMHRDVRFFVVGSDQDQFEPRQVKLARKRLVRYGVDVQVLSGGHMITMEQPKILADKIIAIANQV